MDVQDPFERALVRQLYRFRCPEPHVLGEFHLGLLDDPRRGEVEEHLRECPHCQEELNTLERFLRVRDRPSVRVLVAEWLPQLRVAEMAPGYALRGTLHLTSATYRAGEFTLTVSITEDPQDASLRTVAGIVSCEGELLARGRARLVGAELEREVELDPVGQFAFDRVARARYTLEVEVGDALVQVSPLEVG